MPAHNAVWDVLEALANGFTNITADTTLTPQDSGKIIVANAADLTITLPPTEKGLCYIIVTGVASSVTGLSISPNASDAINEGTDDKDLINTQATEAVGDAVILFGDGDTGWYTLSSRGTWAAEA